MAFFSTELEGVATFWRILRRDGVALGFTSHDRSLWFDGVLHRAAPGMVPSAIRLSGGLDADSAEVSGALDHAAICADDLQIGRYGGATILIGAINWESRESAVLYRGTIGAMSHHSGQFTAQMDSAKTALFVDPVPRTSPACRAQFCGPGCNLSPALYEECPALIGFSREGNWVRFDVSDPALFLDGEIVWFDGPMAGLRQQILAHDDGELTLDSPLAAGLVPGMHARLRQGCDHSLETCRDHFANAANFRGEPYLPGNDLLARYPRPL